MGRVSGGGGRYLAKDGSVVEEMEDLPCIVMDGATDEADKCPCQEDHGVSPRSARVGRVSGGGGRHLEKDGVQKCPCGADQNDNTVSTRSARVGRVSGGGGR